MQIGKQTIKFAHKPTIISSASVVGPKEGKGKLRDYYDLVLEDSLWGEENWDMAESKILRKAIALSIDKLEHISSIDVRYIFSGDLLNQLVGSTFALREINRPFLGLYGACSTMGESMILASMTVDGGYANAALAATSSHFCSAEKQFRYPLEYGAQKKEFTTLTVTGSGAVVIANEGKGPKVTYGIPGRIVDFGLKDAMNMGAAMAPAASDTIVKFFEDTDCKVEEFDRFITGDLGIYGKKILIEMLKQKGLNIENNYIDCGEIIFDNSEMESCAGGSGCGCSAATLCGYILSKLNSHEWNKVFFLPTGALLNTMSINEGESIPCVAHGVVIENEEN